MFFSRSYPITRNRFKIKVRNVSIFYSTQSLIDIEMFYKNLQIEFENNIYLKKRLNIVLYSPNIKPSFKPDEYCFQVIFTTRIAYNDYEIFERIFERMIIASSTGNFIENSYLVF
jgi:hypothetical protein